MFVHLYDFISHNMILFLNTCHLIANNGYRFVYNYFKTYITKYYTYIATFVHLIWNRQKTKRVLIVDILATWWKIQLIHYFFIYLHPTGRFNYGSRDGPYCILS